MTEYTPPILVGMTQPELFARIQDARTRLEDAEDTAAARRGAYNALVIEAVRRGLPVVDVARAAGIHRNNVYKIIRQAEDTHNAETPPAASEDATGGE